MFKKGGKTPTNIKNNDKGLKLIMVNYYPQIMPIS